MTRLKIFICTHKQIDNPYPTNKDIYTIISNIKGVTSEYLPVIDISEDKFTKTHKRSYSEGCHMRYLYNHPELLPDYVGINHYRRFFIDIPNNEDEIIDIVDKCGTIRMLPFNHSVTHRKNNKHAMYIDHVPEEFDRIIDSVKEIAPEYYDTFLDECNDYRQYGCNMVVMKKEDFLEMCEVCFRILDHYDKKQGYKNDVDVLYKMINYETINGWTVGNVLWQSRLQGFYLELLTEMYARQKYGINKFYLSRIGIPNIQEEDNDKLYNSTTSMNLSNKVNKDGKAKTNKES